MVTLEPPTLYNLLSMRWGSTAATHAYTNQPTTRRFLSPVKRETIPLSLPPIHLPHPHSPRVNVTVNGFPLSVSGKSRRDRQGTFLILLGSIEMRTNIYMYVCMNVRCLARVYLNICRGKFRRHSCRSRWKKFETKRENETDSHWSRYFFFFY